MQKVYLCFLIFSIALCENGLKPNYFNSFINQEMVDAIKAAGAKWETIPPHKNPLRHYTDKEIIRATTMPGFDYAEYIKKTNSMGEAMKKINGNQEKKKGINIPNIPAKSFALPSNFNWSSTTNGQNCGPSVLNQGTCGGCYAFATAECFAARYCQAGGKSKNDMSPQDIIACNQRTGVCNGGVIEYAFHYLEDYGILPLSCMPYAEATNGDSATKPLQACMPSSCAGSGTFSKAFCKKGTSVQLSGQSNIQNEIYQRGPVATLMTVYNDLMSYSSGIYKYTTGASAGAHAVLIVGWGTSNGVNYWIVQNSWGTSWGQGGYFQIDMTDTTTNLGQYAYYCVPDV